MKFLSVCEEESLLSLAVLWLCRETEGDGKRIELGDQLNVFITPPVIAVSTHVSWNLELKIVDKIEGSLNDAAKVMSNNLEGKIKLS